MLTNTLSADNNNNLTLQLIKLIRKIVNISYTQI